MMSQGLERGPFFKKQLVIPDLRYTEKGQFFRMYRAPTLPCHIYIRSNLLRRQSIPMIYLTTRASVTLVIAATLPSGMPGPHGPNVVLPTGIFLPKS